MLPIPRFRSIILCVVFMQLCLYTRAQVTLPQRIDKIVTKAMTGEHYPAISVAVVQNGKVLFKKAYGVRSEEGTEKTNENTIFSVGSVSKAFTGIGIMLLVQEGKIALDDPIKKYMDNLPKAWGNITIRQYMTHTSGIPDLKAAKDDESFEKSLTIAGKLPMAFPAGTKQQYNNFNFATLGKLIEKVTGMVYLDYMTKNVFAPLQMTRTGLLPNAGNIAMGHSLNKNGKWKIIETHFRAGDYGLASGGLQTSLADFIKLSQALTGKTLLKPKAENEMWTPYSKKLSNTPGWHSRMAGSMLVIHKAGGGTGIGSTCDFKIVPSQNLYVVVMTNKDNNSISPSDISDDILQACFSIPAGGKAGAGEGN